MQCSGRSILSRGFTLVELIAVLVVLGVLSAVAASRIAVIPSSRGSMAAQVLMRDLAYARERAMNTGVTHWVDINTTTHSLSILAEQPPWFGFASRLAVIDPARGVPFQRFFNRDEFAGVTITATSLASNPIGFNRLGRPLTSGGATISTDSSITLTGGRVVTIIGSTGALQRSGNP
jgi:prepilin-type N-terminal cleavage/methylation domain-containing protein